MGCKCTSNDADLVQPEQYIISKNKWAKIPPLKPWSLLDFNPLPIDLPYIDSAPNLPPYIDPTNPLALFRLIWTDDLLEELVVYTNEYTKLYPYQEYKDKSRKVWSPCKWKPTTARELLIYLAVTIYIELSPESDIEEYWTKTRRRGVNHFTVRKNIGKNCW